MKIYVNYKGERVFTFSSNLTLFENLCHKARGRISLTYNDPFPTFMVEVGGVWLFNQSGETVSTMIGNVKAFSFTEKTTIETLKRIFPRHTIIAENSSNVYYREDGESDYEEE